MPALRPQAVCLEVVYSLRWNEELTAQGTDNRGRNGADCGSYVGEGTAAVSGADCGSYVGEGTAAVSGADCGSASKPAAAIPSAGLEREREREGGRREREKDGSG